MFISILRKHPLKYILRQFVLEAAFAGLYCFGRTAKTGSYHRKRTPEHGQQAAAHIIVGQAAFAAQVYIHLDKALIKCLRQAPALIGAQHQRIGMYACAHLLQPLRPSTDLESLIAKGKVVTIEGYDLLACQGLLLGFLLRQFLSGNELCLILLQCLVHMQIVTLAALVT